MVADSPLLRPVKESNTFEQTVERLASAIRLGVVEPGQRLPPERQLAGQLGVSRVTLREAIKALQQASYVTSVRGRAGGTVVVYDPSRRRAVDPRRVVRTLGAAEVLDATAGCAAVGVDIPLGLPVGAGRRACDDETARALGRARSSVFPAPPREVLSAATHPEACTVARRLTGRAISLQSFHIGPKILDWDAVAARPDHVVEVHPELALRRIAPDVVFAPKRSARGAGQRIAALARWIDAPAAPAELPAGARLDDVLDALAAAWSARRFADGTHEELGADVDDRGRPMRVIV